MKKVHLFALCTVCTAMPVLGFAQTVPTGDTPVGVPAANYSANANPSGEVIVPQTNVPVQAATTMGQKGWLVMDDQGAYWWGHDMDANHQLINPVSATQGVYTELETDKSIVVK